jgi:Protein of unknown function (DUF5672)
LNGQSKRPFLADVTLVAVTSVALQATVDALRASMRQADFGKVLLLSDDRPEDLDDNIEWRAIERLTSRLEYSRFMLRGLAEHVRTSHALSIQWDGFVVDGSRWQPRFLEYDYIGAPWPHFTDGNNVGNGGFSLRSQRLLEACTTLPLSRDDLEDIVICRLCRPQLEGEGIRFAPEAIARQFSYERVQPSGQEFGFHGAFNLVRHVSRSDANRIFQSLEPRMLARNERWELLRWGVAKRDPSLALNMLRRLFS